MRLAVDFLSAVLEGFIVYYFFNKMMPQKTDKKLTYALCGLAFVLLVTGATTFFGTSPAAPMLYFAFILGYSFLYKDSFIRRVFSTLLIYVFFMLSEIVVGITLSATYSIPMAQAQENDFFYLQGVIISKLILFFILRVIDIARVENKLNLSARSILLLLTIPLANVVCIYYVAMIAYKINGVASSAAVLLITVLIIFSNVSVFYLLENQVKLQKSHDQLINLERQHELQSEYYRKLKENMILTNKSTHDVKNFMVAISSYLENGNIETAQKKISEFYGKIPARNKISTGNDAVNALVISKMAVIEKEIPKNDIKIMIPPLGETDEIDLCILIGNAIDNAVEACLKIPEKDKRFISVKIQPYNARISMLIENSCIPDEKPGRFISTKKDSFRHGFGIQNMKSICEKYGGEIVYEKENGRFTVSIIL